MPSLCTSSPYLFCALSDHVGSFRVLAILIYAKPQQLIAIPKLFSAELCPRCAIPFSAVPVLRRLSCAGAIQFCAALSRFSAIPSHCKSSPFFACAYPVEPMLNLACAVLRRLSPRCFHALPVEAMPVPFYSCLSSSSSALCYADARQIATALIRRNSLRCESILFCRFSMHSSAIPKHVIAMLNITVALHQVASPYPCSAVHHLCDPMPLSAPLIRRYDWHCRRISLLYLRDSEPFLTLPMLLVASPCPRCSALVCSVTPHVSSLQCPCKSVPALPYRDCATHCRRIALRGFTRPCPNTALRCHAELC